MTNDIAILDYIDFEVYIKQTGTDNRKFFTGVSKVDQKYSRKLKMVEDGLLTGGAAEKLLTNKAADMAELYAKHVITGWKGSIRGEELPAFTEAAVVEVLTAKDNDLLFGDIIQEALNEANFIKEAEEEEIKN